MFKCRLSRKIGHGQAQQDLKRTKAANSHHRNKAPSGAGKSYLLERVAKCFPGEDIIENTQFSDNSFYYWKNGLTGKIIIIEDMEGAANVEYPMRELISKKYITKTVVNKDNK